MNPSAIITWNLTGSVYQTEKYFKHTAPTEYRGTVSVFFRQDYPSYRDFTVSGSNAGSLQIDDRNRKNLILYFGRDIGITYENGIYKLPNDALKVVRFENSALVHSFPVNYESQYAERCRICDRALPL